MPRWMLKCARAWMRAWSRLIASGSAPRPGRPMTSSSRRAMRRAMRWCRRPSMRWLRRRAAPNGWYRHWAWAASPSKARTASTIRMRYSSKRRIALLLCMLCAGAACATRQPQPQPQPALTSAPAVRDDLDAADLQRVRAVTRETARFDAAAASETLSAGAATVRGKLLNRDIFSQPSANLDFEGRQRFQIGNGLFRKDWVAAPSSTQASDGLGPLFNARSCQGCHLKDAGGVVPDAGEEPVSLFLRLSVPPRTDAEKRELDHRLSVLPDPTYGHQLQTFAVAGLPAEARLQIQWQQVEVSLGGGEVAHLRKPTYLITDPGFGPMREDVMISPRIAPQMIG